MLARVTTTYLELTRAAALRPAPAPADGARLELRRAELPSPELSRFLYTAVGGDWHWTDRLGWKFDDWLAHLSRPGIETHVATLQGTPCGYFELDVQGPDVEVAYFGLLPRFVGRGIGGWLLQRAVEVGFSRDEVRRVWLHTCSLDHPRALANYLARGFRVFREEEALKEIAEPSPGPWPGAR